MSDLEELQRDLNVARARVAELFERSQLAEAKVARLSRAIEAFLALHAAASGRSCQCRLCQQFRVALGAEEGK